MNHSPKSILGSISSLRLTIYSALFSAILLGSVSYILIQKNHEWNRVIDKMENVLFFAQKEASKKNEDDALRKFYRKSKSRYLQEQLESLPLLQEECESLTQLLHSPGFCGNKILEERLHFLTSPLNQIKLEEQALYTSGHFKEIEVRLSHPVELSLNDLETLLKKIETPSPSKPLIQVTHFGLKRKKPVDQNEVFEINFKILKREFLDL